MGDSNKLILDACCGSRMFWFDKNNPNVMFMDNRELDTTLCDGRKLIISPDTIADFRDIPFADNSFYLVVFDPPHLIKVGDTSWLAKKYGKLDKVTWRDDIQKGFNECMRVLKPNGTLIFKWNETDVSIREIIKVIGCEPLFGHTTKASGNTTWLCFMKLDFVPEENAELLFKIEELEYEIYQLKNNQSLSEFCRLNQ
jgi:SAM-dependent methyltransferase